MDTDPAAEEVVGTRGPDNPSHRRIAASPRARDLNRHATPNGLKKSGFSAIFHLGVGLEL